MIDIENVSVYYRQHGERKAALERVCLHVGKGEICVLIGPSGCGKTTLLHVIAGICKDYDGCVRLGEGQRVPRPCVSLIQQDYGLLDWATVYDNMVLGLRIKKENIAAHRDEIEAIASSLGLTDLFRKYPRQLSGGERQRVSIAQSFVLKPNILLMDEPFSALDALNREKLQDLFLHIWRENRVSVVFVTHSIEEALTVGSRIAIMSPSPGRVERVLNNDLFGRELETLRLQPEFYAQSIALREMAGALWS